MFKRSLIRISLNNWRAGMPPNVLGAKEARRIFDVSLLHYLSRPWQAFKSRTRPHFIHNSCISEGTLPAQIRNVIFDCQRTNLNVNEIIWLQSESVPRHEARPCHQKSAVRKIESAGQMFCQLR
jgi:hypothetical protein